MTCLWIGYILYQRRRSSKRALLSARKRKVKQAAAVQRRTQPGADTDDKVRSRLGAVLATSKGHVHSLDKDITACLVAHGDLSNMAAIGSFEHRCVRAAL